MKKSPVITVVAIGIGAALFFVLGRFVAIPSPVPNTNIALQYGLLAWVLVAPVLDIVMYAEPANKVFLQGLVSAGINILATGIVGTLLLFAYAAAKPKKGSLKKEK